MLHRFAAFVFIQHLDLVGMTNALPIISR